MKATSYLKTRFPLPTSKCSNFKVLFQQFCDTKVRESRWEAARIKSYGTAKLIKGETYDVEYIAGLQVRHWH